MVGGRKSRFKCPAQAAFSWFAMRRMKRSLAASSRPERFIRNLFICTALEDVLEAQEYKAWLFFARASPCCQLPCHCSSLGLTFGCGSKICAQNGTLVNGHFNYNLLSSGGLILTHPFQRSVSDSGTVKPRGIAEEMEAEGDLPPDPEKDARDLETRSAEKSGDGWYLWHPAFSVLGASGKTAERPKHCCASFAPEISAAHLVNMSNID